MILDFKFFFALKEKKNFSQSSKYYDVVLPQSILNDFTGSICAKEFWLLKVIHGNFGIKKGYVLKNKK